MMGTGQILMDVLLFVCDAILLLAGYLVKYHASGYPDTFCGFHAGKLAYQSESTWREANRYCGSFLLYAALFLLIPDVLIVVATWFYGSGAAKENVALTVFQIVYLMLSLIIPTVLAIVLTNLRLKKLFGEGDAEERRADSKHRD